MKPIFYLTLALFAGTDPSSFAATSSLDAKLDHLYQQVSAEFAADSWFHNAADPDLYLIPSWGTKLNLPPEFKMMDLALFKSTLKTYCVFLESKSKTLNDLRQQGVKFNFNPDRLSVLDFSKDSHERRLYVYDLSKKQVIQNTWSAHGGGSDFNAKFFLKDVDYGVSHPEAADEVVLWHNGNAVSSFFSNIENSLQSSVGLALMSDTPYWSTTYSANAFRLYGIDGKLNDLLFDRAMVVHPDHFKPSEMGPSGFPNSSGCLTLQKIGFFRGHPTSKIYDLIAQDMSGGLVLFYHPRMISPALNQIFYQTDLLMLQNLRVELLKNWGKTRAKFVMSDADSQRFLEHFQNELDGLQLKINATESYFRTASLFFAKEPSNQAQCAAVLGI